VLLEELGHHLVLAGQFRRLDRDLLFKLPLPRVAAPLERCRAVLKKHLLPPVEDRWIQPVLVAQVRNGRAVRKTPPQNGDLLRRRKRPSPVRHGQKLLCGHMLTAHEALSNSV